MAVRIFVEGNPVLNTGILEFLRKCLDNQLDGWLVNCRGGISETIRAFILAVEDNIAGKTNDALVLLVDSDTYIDPSADRAQHLMQHRSLANVKNDRLKQRLLKQGIAAKNVFFMVQEMEAWFLADWLALERYFRAVDVPLSASQPETDVEQIPHPSALLHQITGGRYNKTSHAAVLLYHLNPQQVAKLPHFTQFLDHLRYLLGKQAK